MTSCYEMKLGEIYTCSSCGIELQVVAECRDKALETVGNGCGSGCGCSTDKPKHEAACTFACCGKSLMQKAS